MHGQQNVKKYEFKSTVLVHIILDPKQHYENLLLTSMYVSPV